MDGNGQPKALGLTPGPAADCTAAERLLAKTDAGMTVIANKAHGTNTIVDHLANVGAIPSRSNRTEPRMRDPAVSATRNPVERFFGRIRGSGESPSDMTSEPET